MKNYKLKILKILIILILLIIILPNFIEANQNFDIDFQSKGESIDTVNNLVDKSLGTTISIVRVVGLGIAIIILLVIACRYMISAPGDRAEMKKYAVPYIIGALILFGVSGLLGIIADIAEKI